MASARWTGRQALRFVLTTVLAVASGSARAGERKTENVILITLDGARTQEIFGGLDLEILKAATKKGKAEETETYKRYWAAAPEERRLKLMPFFWGTLMKEHGSIAGNRARGSIARITNKHRFSYPGYSEILTGEARDDVIKTNDKVQNPYATVLELLKKELGLDASRVAAFASWDVLKWIVERERGTITSNAGFEPYDHPDPAIALLSRLQRETTTPWDSVRHDVYTCRFAMGHLAAFSPRVLYIGLGETDDWSHDGRYDRTLQALERTDGYLRELWAFLEASERYREKTTLLLTTDHGRGDTAADWKEHGEKVEGAQYTWIACAGPDSPARGEWSDAETVYQSQIAATLCRFLGVDWSRHNPRAGKAIERFFGK